MHKSDWEAPHISSRAVVGGAAASTAVLIGVAVASRKTGRIDHAVRRMVKPRRGPRIVKLARGISAVAAPNVHPFVALVLSAYVSATQRRVCVSPLIASAAATLVDKSARFIVHQHRPPGATRRKGRERFAYPSGHTAATTALTFAAAIELTDGSPRSERLVAYAIAGICSAAVGWSRLKLDEHWIDDVVGGWATGVAIAVASTALANSRRSPVRRALGGA